MPSQTVITALNASTTSDATGNTISGSSSSGGVERDTTNGAAVPVIPPKKKLVIIEKITPEPERKQGDYTKYSIRTDTQKSTADTIFLHYTASGHDVSESGVEEVNGHITSDGEYVSSHFMLLRNGRIIQLFGLDKTVNTQGLKSSSYGAMQGRDPRSRHVWSKKEAGIVNPNDYSYSIECVSTTGEAGALKTAQLKALPHNIRYIQHYARTAFHKNIALKRYWNGFPFLPGFGDYGSVKTGYSDADGNAISRPIRLYYEVYGNLLGHNDINGSFCPGAYFPWQSILQSLGIYPPTYGYATLALRQEISERDIGLRSKGEEFYETKEEYQNKKAVLQEERETLGEDSPSPTELRELLGNEPIPPYYRDPEYTPETVEYIIWERSWDDIRNDENPDESRKTYLEGTLEFIEDEYEVLA